MTAAKRKLGTALRQVAVVLLLISVPNLGWGQSNSPAPLPPAAQQALDKGIIAAKVPDYLLAIRFFEEARKLAPKAPVIFMNLGIAESKMPGRELRAIAWFGAYLAAFPDAPNAAAVKEQITVLDVKNQSNVSRLIKTVQNAAGGSHTGLRVVAGLWAAAGDIPAALKTADLIQDAQYKSYARNDIAKIQAARGDIAGAQATADLIRDPSYKSEALGHIAGAQAAAGDIAGALRTVGLIQVQGTTGAVDKDNALMNIAEAQVAVGDIAGAQKTGALIQVDFYKASTLGRIAEAQKKYNTVAPNSTRQLPSDTRPTTQPILKVADWLERLDHEGTQWDCALNTRPFLDLAGFLKSLPSSRDPNKVFNGLSEASEKLVRAQNIVHQMLKQQAMR
jgi:tetratricopeptide (TPR) repeat protein